MPEEIKITENAMPGAAESNPQGPAAAPSGSVPGKENAAPPVEPAPPPSSAPPAAESQPAPPSEEPIAPPSPETPPPSPEASREQASQSPATPSQPSQPRPPGPEPPAQNHPSPAPPPPPVSPNPSALPSQSIVKTLLTRARNTIFQKREKKLERILAFMEKEGKITNNQIERLVRVSDATATRYMDILEKRGKARQVGDRGGWVFYEKAG